MNGTQPAVFTEATCLQQMRGEDGLEFLLFSTPDCGVCDALKEKLPVWAAEHGYQARFIWLDLSRFPQAASEFQVLSVPTLSVRLDGQELSRQLRHINLSLLQEQIGRAYRLWSSDSGQS